MTPLRSERGAFPLAADPQRDGQSSAALALAQRLALDLGELAELSKRDPAAADQLVGALISHLRSTRPGAVSPLSLRRPTEPIREPRSGGGR